MQNEVIELDKDERTRPSHEQDGSQDGAEGVRVTVRRGWRGMFSKRWAFPVLYLSAAVLIIGVMYAQANRGPQVTHGGPATQAPAVTATTPDWVWPVSPTAKGVVLVRGYYDRTAPGASVASLTKDLVKIGRGYQGSTGYDLANPHSTQPWTVVAAAAGRVTEVRTSPLMGRTVEIDDADGYTTVYQSLSRVLVKEGQTVSAGEAIGTAGHNQLEASLGRHLYFEVDKRGVAIDPADVLPKTAV
jgi:stage II sporulation protein Q